MEAVFSNDTEQLTLNIVHLIKQLLQFQFPFLKLQSKLLIEYDHFVLIKLSSFLYLLALVQWELVVAQLRQQGSRNSNQPRIQPGHPLRMSFKNREEQREGFKLMEEGINQYRKVRFRGIDSVPIDLLYLLLVSIGIQYFMTLYNYK